MTAVLRAGFDALSCAALGALVIEIPGSPRILDPSASRRLVLTAQQSGVTVFLLRSDAEAETSAAETRWLVRAAPSIRFAHISPTHSRGGGKVSGGGWGYPRFETELVRHRHGRTGHWMMEWNCEPSPLPGGGFALWFPRLPTDRLQRRTRNASPDAPPLVIAAKLGNALRISALDRKASRLGLRPAMPLAHARAMLPALEVANADEQADRHLLKASPIGACITPRSWRSIRRTDCCLI